jgi:uncharacterized protein (DUF697 family)
MTEKREKSLKTVRNYMWWSMGAGLIPVPFVDLAAISGVQLKMLADVSKHYEIPFEETRVKAIIGALIGFVVPQSLVCGVLGSLIKAIPGIGAFAGGPALALFAGGTTWALGQVFIQHFESGGTFLDFNPEKVEEYFKSKFQEGQKVAATMQTETKAEA